MSQTPLSVTVNTHSVRFEPPDLVYFTWVGTVTQDCAMRALDVVEALGQTGLYVLTDISRSDPPKAEVRKIFGYRAAQFRFNAVAVIETNRVKRTIMAMLIRAINAISQHTTKAAFFNNEADARAFLNAERQSARR